MRMSVAAKKSLVHGDVSRCAAGMICHVPVETEIA